MFDRAILTILQIYKTMNIICIVCDKGYTGINCVFKCPFPQYGYYCLSMCDCNVTYCDHVNGCIQSSGGKIIFLLYLVSPMTDLKDSDRCGDTHFYYQVKGQKDFREKSMVHCYILQILFQNV